MKISKVDFVEYVLIPGQANGRVTTIFAKDVDQIELLPNGVRVTKGAKAAFFFERNVKGVEFETTPAPKLASASEPIKVEKGKAVKLELSE
jgi:hypothetical protein